MVELADVKAHLRIDHEGDDAYITGLISTVTGEVQNFTGRKIAEFEEVYDPETGEGYDDYDRAAINHAMLIKIGEYYDQDRNNYVFVSMKPSLAFERLLNPYIKC